VTLTFDGIDKIYKSLGFRSFSSIFLLGGAGPRETGWQYVVLIRNYINTLITRREKSPGGTLDS
jgi:hypothetical protein